MSFKTTTHKIKSILYGILMLVFLLPYTTIASIVPDTEIEVIFAIKENFDFNKYNFKELQFLFGNENLPTTYKSRVKGSDLNKLNLDQDVIYTEKNSKVTTAEIIANDPYFTTNETDEEMQWYLDKIKISQAWEYGKGSRDVKVAIIDTGIHSSHVELDDGRVIAGFDMVAGRAIPAESNSDDNGHGTAVAGVIGAITNNGLGVAGINWEVSLMPVKALSSNGSGTISSIATSIVWAAENGADIINLSLGGSGFGDDQTLNNSIIYAYNKGAVIVSAAGNDLADQGTSLDTTPIYPVCADGGQNMVIGVAASDVNDRKASFSNYGRDCIDITAPGKRILTTAYLPNDPSDNILIYGSGTSLATPIVSGVAALLKSTNRSLTNAQIKDIILKTADNIDYLNQNTCLGLNCNGFLGKGRINASSVLSPQPLLDGTLVRESATGVIYLISGGQKKLVTDFVFKQRGYVPAQVIIEINNQLKNLPVSSPLAPIDGTLVKNPDDPTVYVIHQGIKRPLLFIVFQSRNFKFSDVKVLPTSELNIIQTGEWYWPPDGVMVLVKGNPTVYVMHDGVKRPVTFFVFNQRKLSFARVVELSPDEFSHLPQAPDAFWLPPVDGTLIKADNSSEVVVIVDGVRRPLSYEAFVSRGYQFKDIKTLPQAEIQVIQLGPAL